MKKIFTICAALLMVACVFAQAPEKMSYQAVIRNASNDLVTNTVVAMQISLLQGSPSGTAVFVETQSPTTNANGLVSIELGGGTVVSGNFSTINWATGPYFVKTEIDPNGTTGGISYSITSISQLLSVPYALHAKSAETITGSISEADPVFMLWDKDYNDLINKPTIDGSVTNEIQTLSITNNNLSISGTGGNTVTLPSTIINAGANVTITGSGTNSTPYVISASANSGSHYIGELYGGGVVFWIDQTGEHGLIVSMIALSNSQPWSIYSTTSIGITAQSDWNGLGNSNAIVGPTGNNTSAAKLCLDYINVDYGTGVFSDWYLPSRCELTHLWNNLYEVQKSIDSDGNSSTNTISIGYHWSSTEAGATYAYALIFDSGGMTSVANKNSGCVVRAVRAF